MTARVRHAAVLPVSMLGSSLDLIRITQVVLESLSYPAEMWCTAALLYASMLPYACMQWRMLLTVFGNAEIVGEEGDVCVCYHA